MSQYKPTANFTNGSATVTIPSLDASAEISAGDYCAKNGDGVHYQVDSVLYSSPDTTVTLTTTYAGTTESGVTAVFTRDFTSDGLPILAKNDVETASVTGRLAVVIQTLLDAIGDKVEGVTTHDMASDADYSLTTTEAQAVVIQITDTGPVLTTGRNIILPATIHLFAAINDTAQTLTFKTAAGSGYAVLSGQRAALWCDGTNVESLESISAFARTILDDADAGAVLTTLGVSAFAQTLLDDADAATARATLGVIPGGTSRPATVQTGELWRDTDYGTNQVGLYYYDGTADILVVVVDTAANTSLPSGIGVSVTHNMASDADYTLTTAQNAYGRYIITDTTPSLTTARNIVVSATEREFTGQNDTAEVLTFKTSGGTGVAVYPGTATRLYCDGTNVVVPTSGRLIYETEVTGSAVSSIDTGAILDINTHKSYTVELEVANATASTINVYLYYNNDTTVTNYYYDIIDGDGGTITGFRGNAPAIAGIDANGIASLTTNVRLTAGYANAATHCVRYIGSSIKADFVAQAKTNATVSNITQLTVGADVASSFAVGCKLRIYRNDI